MIRLNFYQYNVETPIYVFDLDNTLYNTWPFLLKYDKNLYSKVPIFEGMKNKINSLSSNQRVVFLTARKIQFIFETKRRIKTDFDILKFELILVKSAKEKIQYLNHFISQTSDLHYFDDLSYNHETGKVKFYDDIIKKVHKLQLVYYGANQIKKINKC